MASSEARRVVIAMDGSKHSVYALKYYKDNVYQEGDDVTIAMAAEHGQLTSQPVFSTDPAFLAKLNGEEEGEVKKLVEKLTALLTETGVPGKVLRYSGNTPGEAVIKAVETLKADLVVTGMRGLGKITGSGPGQGAALLGQHAGRGRHQGRGDAEGRPGGHRHARPGQDPPHHPGQRQPVHRAPLARARSRLSRKVGQGRGRGQWTRGDHKFKRIFYIFFVCVCGFVNVARGWFRGVDVAYMQIVSVVVQIGYA